MRLPKGATSDGAVILPDIDVFSATYEAVNANSLKEYVPAGSILPTGGATGQVFTKYSNDDYAANWQTPGGVTKGKVIGINSKQYL